MMGAVLRPHRILQVAGMRLYHVEEDYIDYLRGIDSRVPANKGGARPYVGILFTICGVPYYAPLTSPKPKHLKMSNDLDFIKIAGGQYGAINLNNMIPVPSEALIPITIDEEPDAHYRALLQRQAIALNGIDAKIMETARKLYAMVTNNKVALNKHQSAVKERCCDFLLLESALKQYHK